MTTKKAANSIYVPRSIPIGEAIKNVTAKNRMTLRIKGQTEEELAAKITQRGPESTAKDLKPGDEHEGSFMVLPIDQIKPYDRNPRRSANPKYHEIKASIRDRGGLQGNLTVTKRPGSNAYMLYMGGNTRLQILHELYAETGNKRFYQVNVVYHAWKGEADILASHLIENEARGDTLFIEKARGLMMLMTEIETQEGRSIPAREVQELTKSMGMMVNQAIVLLYSFAVNNLEALGIWLTKENTNALKRRYALYDGIARTLRCRGEFETTFAKGVSPLQTEFADDLLARAKLLEEENAIVPLRGAVLDEFIQKLDRLAADCLGLSAAAAKRIFAAIDGKDSISQETLAALINNESPEMEAPASTPAISVEQRPVTRPVPASRTANVARPAQAANDTQEAAKATVSASASAKISVKPNPAVSTNDVAEQTAIADALPEAMTDEVIVALSREFAQTLIEWCQQTRVIQWLRMSNETSVPYMYWLEMPEEIKTLADVRIWNLKDPDIELTPEQIAIRGASYRLLATLSGQLGGVLLTPDGRQATYNPFGLRLPEGSTWRAASMIPFDSMDVLYNIWETNLGGTLGRNMDMSLAQDDLLIVMRNPELVGQWLGFCRAYDKWGKALNQFRTERGLSDQLIATESIR